MFSAALAAALFIGLAGAGESSPQASSPAGAAAAGTPAGTAEEPIVTPRPDPGILALSARAAGQRAAAGQAGIDLDFGFTDRQAESGLGFLHRIVDDTGINFRLNHYDHGNGVAVADVNGDGRLDVYLVSYLGTNGLYENLGGGKFRDVTAAAGVGLPNGISVGASFADIDNDGDPDLYVTRVRKGNILFENDGEGRFEDISGSSGLGHVGHSSGAVFFDYNRDGRLDVFLTNVGVYTGEERGRGGYFIGLNDAFSGHLHPERTEPSLLFENRGGKRFVEVSEERGLVDTGWSGDATAADFNRDGWPDLYVLNMQGDDHYWENQEGKRFVERTPALFPRTPWGAMGVEVFDFDNDGRMDMIVTDMHSDMSEEVGPEREKEKSRMRWEDRHLQGGANNVFGNAFYRNQGNGKFQEASDEIGAENYWPWGVSAGDLNADGWEDLFVSSSMSFPYRYGINSVLMNAASERFVDAEFVLGIEPRAGGRTHVPWFEVDCTTTTEPRLRLLCAGRQGKQTVMGTLGTRSSVIFDLDADGDLDIVTNEFNAHPQVLVSDLAARGPVRFLEVALRGQRSNRDGLGARVTVVAGGRSLTKVHDGKSGYLSQSALPLYFGLGGAARVDRIEITWPSGVEQTVPGPIETNRRIEVVEERGEEG